MTSSSLGASNARLQPKDRACARRTMDQARQSSLLPESLLSSIFNVVVKLSREVVVVFIDAAVAVDTASAVASAVVAAVVSAAIVLDLGTTSAI